MKRFCAAILLALVGASVAVVRAERLPIRTYTIADGLQNDSVNRVVQDSPGYLWIGTDEGLSRFDGYAFTSYGLADGLPGATVMDIVEVGDGSYWVATFGGLARLVIEHPGDVRSMPGWRLRFETRPLGTVPGSSEVRIVHADRRGVLWVGTVAGLYRVDPQSSIWAPQLIEFPFPRGGGSVGHQVNALLDDPDGTLWIATRGGGVLRLGADGRLDRLTTEDGLPTNNVRSLVREGSTVVWAGTADGICRIRTDRGTRAVVERSFGPRDGLPNGSVRTLVLTREGRLFAGTDNGLALYDPSKDPSGAPFRTYASAQDLPHTSLIALTEDRDGNLWIGSRGGLAKLARGGFRTFGPESGFDPGRGIETLGLDRDGNVFAVSKIPTGARYLQWLDGSRFAQVEFPLPRRSWGWGWGQTVLQDSRGEWLVPTGRGIFVFADSRPRARLAGRDAREHVTDRDGLLESDTFRLFEDSRGAIWISPLRRWDRRRGRIEGFPELAPQSAEFASAFAEDRSGAVWFGLYQGDVLRQHGERFERLTPADGVPAGSISSLFLDRKGRLWVGSSSHGVARVDDPSSSRPSFARYTIDRGLSSNEVNCITEDDEGRIYLGTGRGVDRLDPETGQVRRYTGADGLARSRVLHAVRDRNGTLWFATERAVSRLDPTRDGHAPAPDTVISALRIAGAPQPIHPLGETDLGEFVLEPSDNRVEIEFLGVSLGAGERLQFQYRLEGASEEWSAPSDRRSVNYASLSPRRYRFQVRAVTPDGAVGARPATLAFRVLPPIWRRGWFLALLAGLVGLVLLETHRLRVARAVAIERVRTRIATDLHDDIGASLTQIALQSEVLQRELTDAPEGHRKRLEKIATVSRGLVDSMSDIVWAINPRRDRLRDLVQRMRRFALDTLDARGIVLRFDAPEDALDLALDAEARRELYLAFKECIANAVRHSGCSTVEVALRRAERRIVLVVGDDGHGFDPEVERAGTGQASLRHRVNRLRGAIELSSGPANGTRVTISIPLDGRRWLSRGR